MRKTSLWIKLIFMVFLLVPFQGCATESTSVKVEKSLPQEKLVYYGDSFNELREDLWDKAGYMHSEPVRANFRQADMRIEEGMLRIDTKTGSFSKGGLASRYVLRGDFDVQVDCHIDFLDGFHDMDQVIAFTVLGRGSEADEINSVVIGLARRGAPNTNSVFSGLTQKGKYHLGDYYQVGDFHGTLRIVRSGNNIGTFYKMQGKTEWVKMNNYRHSLNDVQVGFKLQNYAGDRTSINAKATVTAKFDNFRINTAQDIVESEI